MRACTLFGEVKSGHFWYPLSPIWDGNHGTNLHPSNEGCILFWERANTKQIAIYFLSLLHSPKVIFIL